MASETRRSQEKEFTAELLTREEKEALLDQKIQMMKVRNAERMKKFQEIEEDKKWAEREGRAVTLKQAEFSDNEDDAWPKRTDRFDEGRAERDNQPKDLRQVLQRKTPNKASPEQANAGRRPAVSKYQALLEDGPPPDPAYNYLADRDRDFHSNEMRGGNRNRRGFQHENPRGRRSNGQRGSYAGHDQPPRRQVEEERNRGDARVKYDHWRKERDDIDRERIERQKTNEGWKREWDRDKMENSSQKHEARSFQDAGQRVGDEQSPSFANTPRPLLGGSQPRGALYHGGRGRLRQDIKSSSPGAGSTPDRETDTQKPPRFRQSPDNQRPGNTPKQLTSTGAMHSPQNIHTGVQPGSINRIGLDQRASPRGIVKPLIETDTRSPISRDYNAIIITVGNKGHENQEEPVTRVVQNKTEPGQSPETRTEVELLTHTQFTRSPRKAIGSGRLAPPPKVKTAIRGGKDGGRKVPSAKGRRTVNRWPSSDNDNEPVTIGIAVITTPGEKNEKNVDINQEAEDMYLDVPPKSEVDPTNDNAASLDLIDDEAIEDDDDDEWEDVDEGSVEYDDNLKRELNKSNESIDRFIEEHTLHPDGKNWNIEVDGVNIPWSDQMDAASQERHRRENEWRKPSDPNLDTSYQSSCSIVESPFEQSEVLSSLLAAACDSSAEGPILEPGSPDQQLNDRSKPCLDSESNVIQSSLDLDQSKAAVGQSDLQISLASSEVAEISTGCLSEPVVEVSADLPSQPSEVDKIDKLDFTEIPSESFKPSVQPEAVDSTTDSVCPDASVVQDTAEPNASETNAMDSQFDESCSKVTDLQCDESSSKVTDSQFDESCLKVTDSQVDESSAKVADSQCDEQSSSSVTEVPSCVSVVKAELNNPADQLVQSSDVVTSEAEEQVMSPVLDTESSFVTPSPPSDQ